MVGIEQEEEGRIMSDKPTAKERHCWHCGGSMGVIENRHYRRGDTCGKQECERDARDAERYERDEAHERLDRDMGWN